MRLIKSFFLFLIIVVFAIFVFQNMVHVRLGFLNLHLEMPLSLVSVVIYLLGAFTGGLVYSMLKKLTLDNNKKNDD